MRFQKATWIVERAGWSLLALFVLAALSGVFSHGYLSKATVRQSGFALDYERFQRTSVLTRLTVKLPAPSEDEARLRFSPSLQDAYEIEAVEPRPVRSSADGASLNLFFDSPERGETTVVFWARPRRFGSVTLRASTASADELAFRIFIYP